MIDPSLSPVRTAEPDQHDHIVDLLTLAFVDDAVCRYLYPDLGQYLEFFPQYVRLYGQPGFEIGGAHVLGQAAAALWIPPGLHADEASLDALLTRSVAASARAELFKVYEEFDRAHPPEPHWFLPLMGVDPFLRGQGAGARLMEYGLALCDRDGSLAYLESTKPGNVPFYERFGFETCGLIDVGGHPPVQTMRREPR